GGGRGSPAGRPQAAPGRQARPHPGASRGPEHLSRGPGLRGRAMWDERFAEVCRRHDDLVAVYESARGRLGLLLCHTLVPLESERLAWVDATRAAARRIGDDLRAAGFEGATVVLQWLPVPDVARIVGRWIRRWDGDPVRRSQLIGQIEAGVTGRHRALDETGLEALRGLVRDDGVVLARHPASAASSPRSSDARVDRRARAHRPG